MAAGKRRYVECGNCGAPVPEGRPACRECGADADTGWQSEEDVFLQSIELPDGIGEDFDPDAGSDSRTPGGRPILVVVVIVLILALTGLARLLV